MESIFDLASSALPDETLTLSFHGTERISTPYHYEIHVSAPAADLELEGAVGLKATLSIRHGDDPYNIHGIISAAELLLEQGDRAIVRIQMVPRLWLLGLSRHSRIFTEKKVPDIIKEVLEGADLGGDAVSLKLDRSYSPEAHVCQYKESDLSFISRWMEREGLYYFFEQGESSEKLVITDNKAYHKKLVDTPVPYRPATDRDTSAGDSFASFICKKRVVAGKVKLRDYDYAKPSLDVSGEASVANGTAAEVVLHGQRFFAPDQGGQLAKIRSEEILAQAAVFEGRGRVFGLRSGYLFEIEDHPRDSINGEYLCTALTQRGSQRVTTAEMRALTGVRDDETLYVHATAIRSDVQMRAPRTTPWPRVYGTESATIDGPADSDYAQIDDDGRYNIKLAFDESDLSGGKASTTARMMQPHAGNPEGFHLPLRKGTEVMVAFLGGDPDRPVIAGGVPNAETPSVVTSSNNTKNILHTGSDNHIEIEDEKGKQWIDIKTPPQDTYLHLGATHGAQTHNIVAHTGGDCLFEIGTNQDINVGATLTETVKGAVDETYKTSQTSDVKGPQTTIVKGAVEEKYTGGHKTTTTGLVAELYESTQKTTVTGGGRNERYESGQTVLVSGGVTQTYQSAQDLTQTGGSTQTYKGTFLSLATGKATLTYDGAVTQDWGETTAIWASCNWTIPGAANVRTKEWKLTMTKASIISQIVTELKLNMAQAAILSIAYAKLKIDLSAVSLGSTVLKLEVNGLDAKAYGVSVSLISIKLDTKSSSTSTAAVQGK